MLQGPQAKGSEIDDFTGVILLSYLFLLCYSELSITFKEYLLACSQLCQMELRE